MYAYITDRTAMLVIFVSTARRVSIIRWPISVNLPTQKLATEVEAIVEATLFPS